MPNQLTTIANLDLAHITGGAEDSEVCTPENPTGERQPTQFWESSPPESQRTTMPPDPRDSQFPPFRRRPPTEADGERMRRGIDTIRDWFR